MTTLKYTRKSRKCRQDTTATATGNRSGRRWGGGSAALSTDRTPIRDRDSRNCNTRSEGHLRQPSCHLPAGCSVLFHTAQKSDSPCSLHWDRSAGNGCKR